MPNDLPPNDWKDLWQSQPVERVTMSLEEIRRQAVSFQRKIRLRNLREYAAVAFIVVFFSFSIFKFPDGLTRTGCALLIAGVLYVAWQLHRRGSAKAVAADMASETCIAFHRRELERQRDAVRAVWSWYLGPMVPGMAVIMLAGLLANPGHLAHPGRFVGAYAVVVALVFFLVGRMNQRAAHKLQRKIDALAEMEKES